MNPPPFPTVQRSARRTPWLWIIVSLAVALLFILAIGSAILIPTVAKVRETARRTADASNARQVIQAMLIWSSQHEGLLPPVRLGADGAPDGPSDATIHTLAAALARVAGLDDARIWFPIDDRGRPAEPPARLARVLDSSGRAIEPEFAAQTVFGWDVVTGLSTDMSPTTPVAWTRGLRTDGTWDPETSVYGKRGGYVVFLGGNVQFFPDLAGSPVSRQDGTQTSNILEALPSYTRVVGAGPGSLHGQHGLATSRQSRTR